MFLTVRDLILTGIVGYSSPLSVTLYVSIRLIIFSLRRAIVWKKMTTVAASPTQPRFESTFSWYKHRVTSPHPHPSNNHVLCSHHSNHSRSGKNRATNQHWAIFRSSSWEVIFNKNQERNAPLVSEQSRSINSKYENVKRSDDSSAETTVSYAGGSSSRCRNGDAIFVSQWQKEALRINHQTFISCMIVFGTAFLVPWLRIADSGDGV